MQETAIDRIERDLGVSLGLWGVTSTLAGAVIALTATRPRVRAFGAQTAAWGAVDASIAAVAHVRARSPRRPDAAQRRRSLGRLLAVNTVLDVGYVAGGVALLRYADRIADAGPLSGRRSAAELRGDGSAVVVQGGFLLLLDSVNLVRVARAGTRR